MNATFLLLCRDRPNCLGGGVCLYEERCVKVGESETWRGSELVFQLLEGLLGLLGPLEGCLRGSEGEEGDVWYGG